jgi:hypothetical protein
MPKVSISGDRILVQELINQRDYTPEQVAALRRQTQKNVELELWKKCYPRIYQNYKPQEYPATPKDVAFMLLQIAKKIEFGYKGQSEMYEAMWAGHLAQYRVPLYWVSRDLALAVQQTVPPMEVNWYDMELPYPAAVFILPKGILKHRKEGNVGFISYTRQRKTDAIPGIWKGPETWHSRNGGLVLLGQTEAHYLTHWNIPYDKFPTLNLGALDAELNKYEPVEHSSSYFQETMGPEDNQLGKEVTHLLFGLLLLMTRRKELVKMGKLESKAPANPKKGVLEREFWSPTVIGENYRIRRVYEPSQGGTHASPRFHYVRGHWKDVRHGPGKAYVREDWIEPYERGLDEE